MGLDDKNVISNITIQQTQNGRPLPISTEPIMTALIITMPRTEPTSTPPIINAPTRTAPTSTPPIIKAPTRTAPTKSAQSRASPINSVPLMDSVKMNTRKPSNKYYNYFNPPKTPLKPKKDKCCCSNFLGKFQKKPHQLPQPKTQEEKQRGYVTILTISNRIKKSPGIKEIDPVDTVSNI